MNAARRKELARAVALIEEAQAIVEACASDERDYFDAMPESLQDGERGQRASEAADTLEEQHMALTDAASAIEEARA